MPFELARTLLSTGRTQRRAKQWGPARQSFERALSSFESLGAGLWAEAAREDLQRIGGRTPSSDTELTAGERQACELVAQGLTNREVADSLFISLKTVEATLTRAYRKLGVRSRSELRALFAGRLPPNGGAGPNGGFREGAPG
jgi:DNA-binding CsgD family transcriptional regulator